MKLLYRPFALIATFIAVRIGRKAFRGVWDRIDHEDPPSPTEPDASMPKLVGAAALEAATMAAVAATADRLTARAFHHLFGVWPGQKRKEEDREG